MTEHEIKYEELSQKYGIRWTKNSPQFVGETLETLIEKYKKDVHLNNVPLKRWDFLASQMRVPIHHYEKVCLAKYAAIKMLKSVMEENNVTKREKKGEEMTEQELVMRMNELIKILDFVKKVTSMRWDNPGVILGLLNGMLDTDRDESVMVFSTESLIDFMRNWNSCVRRTAKHYEEKDMLRITKSILNIYEKDAEPIMHILDSMLEDKNGSPIVQFCANLLNDIRH